MRVCAAACVRAERWGIEDGTAVWQALNGVFEAMPLAATVQVAGTSQLLAQAASAPAAATLPAGMASPATGAQSTATGAGAAETTPQLSANTMAGNQCPSQQVQNCTQGAALEAGASEDEDAQRPMASTPPAAAQPAAAAPLAAPPQLPPATSTACQAMDVDVDAWACLHTAPGADLPTPARKAVAAVVQAALAAAKQRALPPAPGVPAGAKPEAAPAVQSTASGGPASLDGTGAPGGGPREQNDGAAAATGLLPFYGFKCMMMEGVEMAAPHGGKGSAGAPAAAGSTSSGEEEALPEQDLGASDADVTWEAHASGAASAVHSQSMLDSCMDALVHQHIQQACAGGTPSVPQSSLAAALSTILQQHAQQAAPWHAAVMAQMQERARAGAADVASPATAAAGASAQHAAAGSMPGLSAEVAAAVRRRRLLCMHGGIGLLQTLEQVSE